MGADPAVVAKVCRTGAMGCPGKGARSRRSIDGHEESQTSTSAGRTRSRRGLSISATMRMRPSWQTGQPRMSTPVSRSHFSAVHSCSRSGCSGGEGKARPRAILSWRPRVAGGPRAAAVAAGAGGAASGWRRAARGPRRRDWRARGVRGGRCTRRGGPTLRGAQSARPPIAYPATLTRAPRASAWAMYSSGTPTRA